MDKRDDVLRKVKRLLALAGSDNPHEAALAAARAQELLDRHGLEQAMLEPDEAEGPGPLSEETLFGATKTHTGWRVHLASVIAKANGCRILMFGQRRGQNARIQLFGAERDVEKVRALFAACAQAIDALAARHARGRGRAYANSYRLGCAEAVGAAVREEQRKFADETRVKYGERGTRALAVITDRGRAADAWMRSRHRVGQGRAFGSSSSWAGRSAGQRDGAGIYHGTRGRVGSGARRIGPGGA